MNRKILGILVCTLLIATALPAVGMINEKENMMQVFTSNNYLVQKTGAEGYMMTNWLERQKLVASDGTAGDGFGWSVSINGDYAIIGIGAFLDDYIGSAYIFKRTGSSWTEEAKLTASDGTTGDHFGWSVSINGDYAIIGALFDDSATGSAYIFKRIGSSWTQQAKLLASDGAAGDVFGYSVSISGDYAIIGTDGDESTAGSAYIFKRTGSSWTEEAKLTASDGTTGDQFGWSVSINGDYAIIGAYGDDSTTGSAYVFDTLNKPPSAPTIEGEGNGDAGTEYEYSFKSIDPNNDDIAVYIVDWGDDIDKELIIGPFASGDEAFASHRWSEPGDYVIRAKSKDIYSAESEWATSEVSMPKNKAINTPFLRFLEQHPHLFPLLRQLLGLQ